MAACLICPASWATAQTWAIQTLSTRVSPDGQPVTLSIATPAQGDAAAVRHVLLYPQPLGTPQLKTGSGTTALTLGGTWMQALPQLQLHGVSLMYVDVPGDADRRAIGARLPREVRQDLDAAARQARRMYPGAQLHLAGFASVAPLLDIADKLEGFGKLVLAAPALGHFRNRDWSGLRMPVLMLQAPGAQCDAAPFLESEAVAGRNRFTLVKVGYERQDAQPDCGRTSQHVLYGQEAAVAKTVADWLDGKAVGPGIGHPNPPTAWREQIISYAAPGSFGSNRLEATLLLPDAARHGAGPYAVMVWNHGDVELDSPYIRDKSRIRDMLVAREFLHLGVAVLMPARRGVGLSEGNYPKNISALDADATYKARVHAEDILPAIAWLRTRPELDATRVILAGQSAGGYSTLYIASQNPAGLIGAIDFAGGRTDKLNNSTAGHLNQMMVDGFAEFGKTTRMPTLWVFAENDSRYTTNTILASHKAFQEAGAKARLLLSPPIEGDGHFVRNKAGFWREPLREYLVGIGAVAAARPAQASKAATAAPLLPADAAPAAGIMVK
jgi:dienelactone hydrolase